MKDSLKENHFSVILDNRENILFHNASEAQCYICGTTSKPLVHLKEKFGQNDSEGLNENGYIVCQTDYETLLERIEYEQAEKYLQIQAVKEIQNYRP